MVRVKAVPLRTSEAVALPPFVKEEKVSLALLRLSVPPLTTEAPVVIEPVLATVMMPELLIERPTPFRAPLTLSVAFPPMVMEVSAKDPVEPTVIDPLLMAAGR